MEKYNLELSKDELQKLKILLEFSLLEIMRQMKKFGQNDYDLKECFWSYRMTCNNIRNQLKKFD